MVYRIAGKFGGLANRKKNVRFVRVDKCEEWFYNTCEDIPETAWTDEKQQWACSNWK